MEDIPKYTQQVKNVAKGVLGNIHTAMPGKFISFNAATGLAIVLPIGKIHKPDGTKIDYPQVSGVPVVIPQTQGATIAYPIKAGDSCLIIFAERSLDYWMYARDTDADLTFDLSNAIAIPGLLASANSDLKDACNNSAVVVRVGPTKLTLTASGAALTGNLSVSGDVDVAGAIQAAGGVKSATVSLDGHIHSTTDGETGPAQDGG